MSFFLEEEVKADFEFDYKDLAEQVVKGCLEYAGFPFEAEVNLTLTDNQGIWEINKSHRDIDRPTDVLSFPMLEYDTPGDFSFIDEEDDFFFNPDSGDVMLGDIVISVDKVREQAQAYGHSEKREFAFLITHSMLHLFGYDHMETEEASVMEEKQRGILDMLGIKR